MLNRQLLRRLYVVTLSAIAFFLPLSVWLLTFFMIALVVVWLTDGGLMRISELRKIHPAVLVSCGTYFVYLIWMINTTDLSIGLQELKLMLPLLVFPIVIGLSDSLNKPELKTVLSFFITGVVLSSLAGFIFYNLDNSISDIANPRKMSLFITHIRLALMINLSISISVLYFFSETSKRARFIYLFAALWLILFLFLLLSITGIIIFAVLLLISLFMIVKKTGSIILKTSTILFVSALFISAGFFISGEVKAFYKKGKAYSYPLKERTVNGNAYLHYPERKDIENGNLVWIYLNEDELRKEWNLRSSIKYDSNDFRGQKLRFTMIRYLTSAGLTKDSAGLAELRENDIKFIENGISNRLFTEGKPIKSRIYEIIWQIDYYLNGGNPSGHSVTQRIGFFKTGWHLFLRNFFLGTGTGDYLNEMFKQYQRDESNLVPGYRFLPHNQYLTFLVSFGLIGFILIWCSILIPVVMMKAFRSFLFNMFFLIILFSMFGEDTLETHAGVSFFAYFYSIFVFGKERTEF